MSLLSSVVCILIFNKMQVLTSASLVAPREPPTTKLLTIDEWKNRSNEFKFWVQHTLKHCGQRGMVTEGGMVMLKNLKSWLVGRVKTVVPGFDGSPGAVSVRTSQGVFMRPIQSVCPLPPISRWPVSRLSDMF
ncbi:hypothetical protein JYU34_004486 [Plutella xylostella]|uniref:DUF5641 domain-containing protein n=1 Tax=Plutella xylostella TaxID=51655 RepID=A0ABQ7QY35_PLUXY|nr:hypothetical protein JYU34_004486 [Plutella xylostella]